MQVRAVWPKKYMVPVMFDVLSLGGERHPNEGHQAVTLALAAPFSCSSDKRFEISPSRPLWLYIMASQAMNLTNNLAT